ncbi:hypothetical protein T492DRAFT_198986 [Pavlovales sp. CCMP2436]|nr:hypothetical protein T492DRAFT_198986 [Pavlovales sp. CCMP2436]
MSLPEDDDDDIDYYSDYDEDEHNELIDTSWIDETTGEDELSVVAAFKSTQRTYDRKRTPDGFEFGRTYVCAPGGRWVEEEDGERKWRSAALQGCPKALRKKLAQKNYLDLDMVGAAPCLMMTLARTYKLEDEVPHLRELARDVKAARRTICETSGCTMDDAKKSINMVLHGSPKRRDESEFLTKLREEALAIAGCLWDDPEWHDVKGLCIKERPKFQLLSRAWQTLEHTAPMAEWALLQNDRRVVFIFDGMLVPRSRVVDKVRMAHQFEEATRELCPELKWAVKEWFHFRFRRLCDFATLARKRIGPGKKRFA